MIETRFLHEVAANYYEYMGDILAAETAKTALSQVSIRLVRLRRQRLPVIQRMRLYEASLLQAKNDATDLISFNSRSYEYTKAAAAADMAELVYQMDYEAIKNVKDTLTEFIKLRTKDKEVVRAFNFIRANSTRYIFGNVSDGTIKCRSCKTDIPQGEPLVTTASGRISVHFNYSCITRESAPAKYYINK